MDKASIDSLLEEYFSSGLSARKFAELKGLKFSTFTYWIRRKKRLERKEVSPNFIPLQLNGSPTSSAGLEMIYPNGVRIALNQFDIHQVAQLVKLF